MVKDTVDGGQTRNTVDNVGNPPLKDIQKTAQFKKDYKRLKLRGADMGQLKKVIAALQQDTDLEASYHNHQLEGKWKNSFDCHIQPDWVSIYRITDDSIIL